MRESISLWRPAVDSTEEARSPQSDETHWKSMVCLQPSRVKIRQRPGPPSYDPPTDQLAHNDTKLKRHAAEVWYGRMVKARTDV